MGNWDGELIELLPGSVRVMASAGAGYDWVDVEGLARRGMFCILTGFCLVEGGCEDRW